MLIRYSECDRKCSCICLYTGLHPGQSCQVVCYGQLTVLFRLSSAAASVIVIKQAANCRISDQSYRDIKTIGMTMMANPGQSYYKPCTEVSKIIMNPLMTCTFRCFLIFLSFFHQSHLCMGQLLTILASVCILVPLASVY